MPEFTITDKGRNRLETLRRLHSQRPGDWTQQMLLSKVEEEPQPMYNLDSRLSRVLSYLQQEGLVEEVDSSYNEERSQYRDRGPPYSEERQFNTFRR